MDKISIVVPVHNECYVIKDFINKLKKAIQKINILSECIVVDDGSNDGTADILKMSGIRVLTHSKCLGYGAALKTGIDNANSDIICIIDADNTYAPDDIQELVKFIDKYDMVVGARIKNSARVFPFYQRIAKSFICSLLNIIFRQKILDINSGLRMIKKSIVEKYCFLLPNSFSFTASITLVMLLGNYRIKYVPINYFKRVGRPKVKLFKYTINFIKSYWRIIHSYKIIKRLCVESAAI